MLLVCGACGRVMTTATDLALHVEYHRAHLRSVVDFVRRDTGQEPQVLCLVTREAYPARDLSEARDEE